MCCNSEDNYFIISFPSTHHAMAGERIAMSVCKNKEARLIPIPPEVSAGCGLALKLSPNVLLSVLDTLKKEGIQLESVFFVECSNGKKTYTSKEY
ncbi:MAG: DUF3343 domain-containing protein [Treponema sp.]